MSYCRRLPMHVWLAGLAPLQLFQWIQCTDMSLHLYPCRYLPTFVISYYGRYRQLFEASFRFVLLIDFIHTSVVYTPDDLAADIDNRAERCKGGREKIERVGRHDSKRA